MVFPVNYAFNFWRLNVTVPPLVVLPLLDDRPGLVVSHPREAAVCLVSLEQSTGIKTDTLKQQCL